MLLDHVEISVARGTLTDSFCADLDRFLTAILGWKGETREFTHPIDRVERRERSYRLPNGQYVVINESDEPARPGRDDHIGVLVSADELDRIFERCNSVAFADGRMTLRYVIDGKPSSIDVGAFELRVLFVKYLLPLWIDVQSHDPPRT